MGRDLATRAAAVQERAAAGGDLNPRQQLEAKIEFNQATFALAMPKGTEAVQLVRDIITAVRTTPKLAEAEPNSVLGAAMTCAQLGLRPGVLGQAWILPFWSKAIQGQRAQLIIGYQGFVDLAMRTGMVASVIARNVHANDYIEVDYGVSDTIVHRPNLAGPRGDTTGYYAIVKFVNGGRALQYASREEMEDWRDRFASTKDRSGKVYGPWVDHFDAMARKTLVRQLANYMPKSAAFRDFGAALAADGTVRTDLTPDADVVSASQWVEPDKAEIAAAPEQPYDPAAEHAALIEAEQ